ncbi:hypothetical protein DPMN_078621 [Dreissena polymorpha]|uniref:Uncharacterized protein n=1 Tax=Dreissena polymorpha TaxID=45954 RepID=A0A9D3YQU5_DREPO|nr:hypothetical protein DPMN_078621 [Dreissena polymorpha]
MASLRELIYSTTANNIEPQTTKHKDWFEDNFEEPRGNNAFIGEAHQVHQAYLSYPKFKAMKHTFKNIHIFFNTNFVRCRLLCSAKKPTMSKVITRSAIIRNSKPNRKKCTAADLHDETHLLSLAEIFSSQIKRKSWKDGPTL